MSTILLTGLISGVVSVTVAVVTSRTNLKTADKNSTTANEGIYAKELPELLEQITLLNAERTKLSKQQIESDRLITELRAQVRQLSTRIEELTKQLQKGDKKDEDA